MGIPLNSWFRKSVVATNYVLFDFSFSGKSSPKLYLKKTQNEKSFSRGLISDVKCIIKCNEAYI